MTNMSPRSGHVAPGSPTYWGLAARPLVNRTPPPPTPFGHIGIVPPEVIAAAKASQRQWGVPASVTLAQWIVESAWGSAMPTDSNNPFGIKALETQPAVESETREVIDGKVIITTARFRRFVSLSEAFESAAKLLAPAGRHVAAIEPV